MRPRLLDLMCGAGGCTKGYQRAGFYVVGVDISPQPNYCGDEFVQMDALEFLRRLLNGERVAGYVLADFACIHASPPCRAFTQMSARWRGKGTKADEHDDLLTPTLELLRPLDLPWVVENVIGAKRHMATSLVLHGGQFDLGVHRARRFESNVLLLGFHAPQTEFPIGVYGTRPDGRTTYRYRNAGNYKPGQPGSASKSLIRAAKSLEEASEAMGIDWMTWGEIREAIPPAYTEFIGSQLLAHIDSERKVA